MFSLCNRQAATPIILSAAVIGLGWYAVMLLDSSHIGHPVAYGLLFIAEVIGMVQMLGIWLTVIVGKPDPTPYEVTATKAVLEKNPKLAGIVAVFVPVAGEQIEIIEQTLMAAVAIRFPHVTCVLDDGKSDEVKALAAQLNITYLRRPDRAGWKAGNVNHALERVHCDYFAILDSDHVAEPEFLLETLPWLVANKQLAFVQTPQYMANRDSFVSGGIAEAQEVFYRHVQTGKNKFNAAFCVGTNVLMRTDAIFAIGGIHVSHSEDIWTSLLLHEAGWKSHYLPTVLAKGQAPETVETFLRQQFRWAAGGYEILFSKHNPLLSRTLTLDQKLQYMLTCSFFITGFSVFIFFLLPLLYVYLGWKPLNLGNGWTWLVHFVPYFVTFFLALTHLQGRFPRWRTLVMAMGAFPAHMGAFLSVLTGIRLRWNASGVVRRNIDYVKSVMLHLLLLFLSVGAIPMLLLNERNGTMGLIVSLCLLWNSTVLFALCKRALPGFERVTVPRPSLRYA